MNARSIFQGNLLLHHFIRELKTKMNAYIVLRSFTFIFALLFIYDFATSCSSQGVFGFGKQTVNDLFLK